MSRRSASTIRRVSDERAVGDRRSSRARVAFTRGRARAPFFRNPSRAFQVPVARDNFFVDTRYRNLKPIGGGSYGVVCAADDAASGTRVAIKKITHVFSDLVDAKRILREIKLLRHFDGHENIIAIRDIITVPPATTDFRDVYIITNLMESDLDRIIASNQVAVSERARKRALSLPLSLARNVFARARARSL